MKDTTDIKLTGKQRFDYGCYDMGYYLVNYWVTGFLTIYYTEVVGVPLTQVAALIFFVRIFDAVNDPVIGAMADRSPHDYKVWIKYGGVAVAAFTFLMFAVNPGWPLSLKMIWMWLTYLGVTVTSTCCYMPYMALNGLLTSNSEERNRLSSVRVFLQNVGCQGLGMAAVPMVTFFAPASTGAAAAKGYTISVAICSVLFSIISFYSADRIRVVVKKPKSQEKTDFKTSLSCFIKNPYGLILAVGLLVHGLAQYGIGGILTYYFQYVAGDLGLMTVYSGISLVACFLGSGVMTNLIYRVTRHKGRACMAAWGCYVLFTIPRYFLSAAKVVFWIPFFISQTFVAAAGGLSYGMIGDIADYGEYRQGIRIDGLLSAIMSLMLKIGAALGPSMMLLVINRAGFVSNAPEQTLKVQTALTAGISFIPAGLSLVAVIGFAFYRLSEGKVEEIHGELRKRRERNGV